MSKDWTPVLRGKIYCSPACGGGCTKAAHERAVKEASALATLLGDGWKPEVWENLGWHYSANKGAVNIRPNLHHGTRDADWVIEGYTACFNLEHQVWAVAQAPADALGFAIQEARTIAARLSDACSALLE